MAGSPRSIGSGRRSLRLSSRRARAEPISLRHRRVTTLRRNALGVSTSSALPSHRIHASWTTSSARPRSPSIRYASASIMGRWVSNVSTVVIFLPSDDRMTGRNVTLARVEGGEELAQVGNLGGVVDDDVG